MTHLFLSSEWLDAMEALRDQHRERLPDVELSTRINVTVRDSPFGGELELHLDTTNGVPVLVREHVHPADLTVLTTYQVAVELVRNRDPQQVMSRFLAGEILVQGDVTPLLALQSSRPPEGLEDLAGELGAEISRLTRFPDV